MDEVKLLKVLENDPRISVVDLADILNESAEATAAAWEKLKKEQVICGYHTVINWDRTNNEKVNAIIMVSAKPERDTGYDLVAKKIGNFEEVTSLYLMSGGSEFIVMIEGETMREVGNFVAQKLAPIEGVTGTVTTFILKKYKVEGMMMDEEVVKDERILYSL